MSKLINLVNAGNWRGLFIEELGWNKPQLGPLSIEIEEYDWKLVEVAHYKGVRIWFCGELPDARTQRLIDREVKKHSAERLLIFANDIRQEWRWPQTGDNQGRGQTRLVTHRHFVGSANEALEQRLSMIEIGINESPSVIEMLRRLRSAFDADRVTKAFYRAYVSEHLALQKAVQGIDDDEDRDWYSTLLMNRLMFIYFMQRKGFMDGDRGYLANRLRQVQEVKGKNKFHGFFRDFLLPLFHRGLGSNDGAKGLDDLTRKILGDVPYVNGGIFAVHELEDKFEQLDVPDSAFTRIFAFFDSYQWHLDDSPTGADNEINPDVLGYIFEQFINYEESGKKEKGAYYTKEDVTGYMTVSTVTTRFLDRLEVATGQSCFRLLEEQPSRYIPESLGYGTGESLPEIQDWRKKATSDFGLPGENWFEVRARRERYERVLTQLNAGAIKTVAGLITLDLNIEELALDTIALLTDAKHIATAWTELKAITVLDPTCGSGAFLFAALERLELLYSAVLDAAEAVLLYEKNDFLDELVTEARRHPSRTYFVLKHAAQHNIFGVDLMRGAAEIARLRLYLKLVAQLQEREQVEPLPDLEFNIKTGNLLIGATTADSLLAMGDTLDSMTEAEQLTEEAAAMAELWEAYVAAQESRDDKIIQIAKKALRRTEANLRERLDRFVFARLGASDFRQWREQCQPFHWFAEFSDVFNRGGFDVVIGNPPYIAKGKVDYPTTGHKTSSCPDIYAMCMERAVGVLSKQGRFAMIVMSSLCFNDSYGALRTLLRDRLPVRWVSSFGRIPGALFSAEARVRNTIAIGQSTGATKKLFATGLHRWEEAFRPHLLQCINYHEMPASKDAATGDAWPYIPQVRVAKALWGGKGKIGTGVVKVRGAGPYSAAKTGALGPRGPFMLAYRTNGYNWLPVFVDLPPREDKNGRPVEQSAMKCIWFREEEDRDLALSLLVTRWGFTWWAMTGDDFNVTGGMLADMPGVGGLDASLREEILAVVPSLRAETKRNLTWKWNGDRIGNWYMPGVRSVTERLDMLWGQHFLPDDSPEERLRWLAESYYFTVRTDLTSREAPDEGGDEE